MSSYAYTIDGYSQRFEFSSMLGAGDTGELAKDAAQNCFDYHGGNKKIWPLAIRLYRDGKPIGSARVEMTRAFCATDIRREG